jgi:uncharacterized protein (DUF3820 family)
MMPEPHILRELTTLEMPFDKYKGFTIDRLPVANLAQFERKDFPCGKLGMPLSTMHVIKMNGLEDMLKPLLKS